MKGFKQHGTIGALLTMLLLSTASWSQPPRGEDQLATSATLAMRDLLKTPKVDYGSSQRPPEIFGQREILQALKDYNGIQAAPVSPYYIVGPRDEIVISLWGKIVQTYKPLVDADGFIEFDIGDELDKLHLRFSVNGLHFKELKDKIQRELSKVSSDIDPNRAESSKILVDVTLGRIRGINVTVLGEVHKPGKHTLNTTLGSVFNALAFAGGPTPRASLRSMLLRRPGGKIDRPDLLGFDLYALLEKGEIDEKLFHIQEGDILIVPPRGIVAIIDGEIKRPGAYELREGETLRQLVEMAQGFQPTADLGRIHVIRTHGAEKSQYLDVDYAKQSDLPLIDGDHIDCPPVAETRRMNVVEIKGEGVRLPDVYQFREGMTLKQLVELAGGFHGDAVLESAVFVRTNEDFTRDFMTVDLVEELALPEGQQKKLKPLDKLIVFARFYRTGGEKLVEISGFVKEPGKYKMSNKMTLYDLVFMAGGFSDPDFLIQAYLERADLVRQEAGREVNIPFHLGKLLTSEKSENRPLMSNDRVVVYSVREIEGEKTVSIIGHVRKPGKYCLQKDMRVSDLLFLAGGLKDLDFVKQTYLDRADIVRLDAATQRKKLIPLNLEKVLAGDLEHDAPLQSLDEVMVYAFADYRDRQSVLVAGEVRAPDEYEFTDGMSLRDLISRANGLTENADPQRIEVARFPPASVTGEQAAEIVIAALAEEPAGAPFPLRNGDKVFVRRKVERAEPGRVTINGEVAYPGDYILRDRTERLSNLIERAGGFVQGAAPEGATLLRGEGERRQKVSIDLEAAWEKQRGPADITLLDGDELAVPKQDWSVRVEGAVRFPGAVQYQPGASASYYIEYVGGYAEHAQPKGAVVIWPNGRASKLKKLFFAPKVKPGSTILVPPETEAGEKQARRNKATK